MCSVRTQAGCVMSSHLPPAISQTQLHQSVHPGSVLVLYPRYTNSVCMLVFALPIDFCSGDLRVWQCAPYFECQYCSSKGLQASRTVLPVLGIVCLGWCREGLGTCRNHSSGGMLASAPAQAVPIVVADIMFFYAVPVVKV